MPNLAKLPVVRLGHPALRTKSVPVLQAELKQPKFQKFLDQLAQACIDNNGVGIAAPQVGVNKRVIVVHIAEENPRYPDKALFPLTIIINPKVINPSKKLVEDWEGDLSFRLRALVPRSISCTVTGLDRFGQPIKFKLKDFPARVFQHEIDHLDGIVLLDRVKNRASLTEV